MNKALEALDIIKHCTDLDMPNELNGYHDEIKIIEKHLKVLEIVKEKQVILFDFNHCKSIKDYNMAVKNLTYAKQLTNKEFDLLKEVLK